MIYIGIGSNLGNKVYNIEKAKSYLIMNNVNILKSSSYYETSSWPDPRKPKFYNIVVQSDCNFSPKKLIKIFQSIEKLLGRRQKPKNSPRKCDIDLISHNNKFYKGDISIPHIRMHQRNFVLIPLYELNKNWFHSKLKINIKNLIFSLPIKDIRSIKKV